MIIIDAFGQGSEEWTKARIGNPGASSFNRIVTTKGEPSKSRQEYLYELCGEIISGRKTDGYSNQRMADALNAESESRLYYELVHDVEVTQVALCYPNDLKRYHTSPDGLILSEKAGFETKDAIPKVQAKRLDKGTLPTEHFTQCQGGLLVTDYGYWIFQSYCSGMPTLTLRVERDEAFIKKLKEELERFCFDLDKMVKKIKEITDGRSK